MSVKGFGLDNTVDDIKMVYPVYHGSYIEVTNPKILIRGYGKDFGYGFYVTNNENQAIKFTNKFQKGIVNKYIYDENKTNNLKIKKFNDMTDEWLDFIANCRAGNSHLYDIVEGPMADDQVWNYVRDYLNGIISKSAFWEMAKFNKPTHQICLCTDKALKSLQFIGSYEVIK